MLEECIYTNGYDWMVAFSEGHAAALWLAHYKCEPVDYPDMFWRKCNNDEIVVKDKTCAEWLIELKGKKGLLYSIYHLIPENDLRTTWLWGPGAAVENTVMT